MLLVCLAFSPLQIGLLRLFQHVRHSWLYAHPVCSPAAQIMSTGCIRQAAGFGRSCQQPEPGCTLYFAICQPCGACGFTYMHCAKQHGACQAWLLCTEMASQCCRLCVCTAPLSHHGTAMAASHRTGKAVPERQGIIINQTCSAHVTTCKEARTWDMLFGSVDLFDERYTMCQSTTANYGRGQC